MTGLPTILEAIDAHAHARPGARALDDVSYEQLALRSRAAGARFRDLGIRPGDRVGIYSENRPDAVLAYLGALRAGAIVVPINVLYRTVDLKSLLDDASVSVLCVSKASAEFVPAPWRSNLVLLSDDAGWTRYTDGSLSDSTSVSPKSDDIALLLYTSGATGPPKGARLTHGNLSATAMALVEEFRWSDADTLLVTMPLFHAAGLCSSLNPSLWAGSRVLLHERFHATETLETLGSGQVSMFFGVPTMYARLLEAARPDQCLSNVRLLVSGSSELTATLHDSFMDRFGLSIKQRYGATEVGTVLSNVLEGHTSTLGFPVPGVSLRIVSPEGVDVPSGAWGELVVHGPNVFAGYWRDEKATAEAFFRDDEKRRWYRSGDIVSFDSTRGYTLSGRLREMIINGGFKVVPSEVEHELEKLPGVVAAAVFGELHETRGEVPVAVLEVGPGFSEAATLATLRERLASFKVPRALYVVPALPRTALGKIARGRLREQLPELKRASGK